MMKPIEVKSEMLDILTAGDGILPKLFASGMEEVVDDIQNRAKIFDSKRVLQLTITVIPDETSGHIVIECTSTLKLGKRVPITDEVHISGGVFMRGLQFEIPDDMAMAQKRALE